MKRKRVLFLAFLMISANGVVFAQNLNLKFYSSLEDGDFKSDFSGVAVAIYLNDAELQVIQTKISSMGRDLDKLTKNNSWLCWKALHEWEIQNGETYFVMCAASMYSQDCILIIATIEDGGQSFSWRGKSVSNSDLEQF